MERRSLVAALLALGVGVTVVAARYVHWPPRSSPTSAAATTAFQGSPSARPPTGTRIRVEVLNATRTRGLGRRATFYLRDQGFDVVSWGTAQTTRETTLVMARSAHVEWARLVARALGAARLEVRPDTSGDVDVSVLIGNNWRPPAQPFHP